MILVEFIVVDVKSVFIVVENKLTQEHILKFFGKELSPINLLSELFLYYFDAIFLVHLLQPNYRFLNKC